MEIKEILHKSSSKRSFTYGIHSLLKRADARESADHSFTLYVTHIDSLRGTGASIVLDDKSRSRTKYLIPTDNILVFDWYFSLTNKPHLIGRL